MQHYINRIELAKQRNMPLYLGHNIQNELITIIGEKIKQNIIDALKYSKYYYIILDCTPDVSHEEQITIVFRFVYLNPLMKNVEIREHFVGLCAITDATRKRLDVFIEFSEKFRHKY